MKRIFSILAALTITFAGLGAIPASAHTEVTATSPTEGNEVNIGVIPIEITFGEDLLQSEDFAGSDIVIQTADGEFVPVSCASVDGAVLSASTRIDTVGTASVLWRTVADDGHAVSGSFSFEVVDGGGAVDAMGVADCPNHLNHTPMPTAIATDVLADSSTGSTGDVSIWLGLGIAVIIIFFFAVIGAIRTRKQESKRARENN